MKPDERGPEAYYTAATVLDDVTADIHLTYKFAICFGHPYPGELAQEVDLETPYLRSD